MRESYDKTVCTNTYVHVVGKLLASKATLMD
jgi:hypothetical protein